MILPQQDWGTQEERYDYGLCAPPVGPLVARRTSLLLVCHRSKLQSFPPPKSEGIFTVLYEIPPYAKGESDVIFISRREIEKFMRHFFEINV
jgi:hypothetical protein